MVLVFFVATYKIFTKLFKYFHLQRTQMLLGFIITIILQSVVFAGSYCQTNLFCVNATVSENKDVIFKVQASSTGWFGFGTGGRMAGSNMFVTWGSGQSGVVSSRQASGRSMPSVSNTITVTTMPASSVVPSWAVINTQFRVPLAAVKQYLDAKSFNYAYSASPVSQPANPASSFSIHDSTGVFTADFMANSEVSQADGAGAAPTSILKRPNGVSQETIILTHAALMILAWGLFPWIGIFVARYLKTVLGVWWFRIHVFVMTVCTTVLGMVGSIYMILFKTPAHGATAHQAIGIAMIA